MSDLFSVDDLTARLGRELTTAESARASAVIADVSAGIRNYTRQLLEAVDNDTITVRLRHGCVRCPQRPVTAVSAVVSIEGAPLPYLWGGDDVIQISAAVPDLWSFEPYRTTPRNVMVTYSHGFEVIPSDIVGVGAAIALRTLGQVPTQSGITQESIEGYSYSLGSTGAAGSFGMLPDERAVLDAYRRSTAYIESLPIW